MKSVTFKNRSIDMAGDLHLPPDFEAEKKYAALVCVHPGGGVKEQAIGLYARQLAAQGFVALAYDSSYQGASGGAPHFLDEPMNRVADVSAAVDYLTTLPYVDRDRIGGVGVCAGGGMVVKAASINRRLKAVGTASAVNVGAATRKGWEGKGSLAELTATLDALAGQRTAEAAGAAVAYAPYVPPVGDTGAPRDMQEAAVYYLTPRGQHPNAQNKMLMNAVGAWVGFDAFDLVETLLTQPLLIVAGDEAGSLWHSRELYAKAPGRKELFLVKGAGHMDLYDGEGAATAVNKLAPFFRDALQAATPASKAAAS